MDILKFDDEYKFLSNHYAGSPFEWRGTIWATGEHAFQAAKCALPSDKEKIRACATPGLAKKLGRKVTMAAGWGASRVPIMIDILRAKFSLSAQPDLAVKLIATQGSRLVEGNYWGDEFWGVDATSGKGLNNLGIALMLVRDELVKQGA